MIRQDINKLFVWGNFGKIQIDKNFIISELPFKFFRKKNELYLLGFTNLPIQNNIQSLIEDKKIIIKENKIKQGIIYHDECSETITSLNISTIILQLSNIELKGNNLQLNKIDLRHFNRNLNLDTTVLISKGAQLNCNLNTTRLNVIVLNNGVINTKIEHIDPNGVVRTNRWMLDRLKLTLRDNATVIGIRINVQLIICIPQLQDVSTCSCDIIANNACHVQYVGANPQNNPNIKVYRQIDRAYLPQSSIQEESSDEDEDEDESILYERFSDQLIDEKYSKSPQPRFFMTSEISNQIKDIQVKKKTESICPACMEHRALIVATPCGCAFSCLSCLPRYQYTTDTCPKCRKKITSAVFSVELYNLPNESFCLAGPPSQDVYLDTLTSSAPLDTFICLICRIKVAQVMLQCSHKSICLFCAQEAQQKFDPICPVPGCGTSIIMGMVVPYLTK